MKKILIIGGSGMLGSELLYFFSQKNFYEVYATFRNIKKIKNYEFLKNCKIFEEIDVNNNVLMETIIKKIKPNIVINCVGIIKQNLNINNLKNVFLLNSIFPRYLSHLSKKYKFRFIHFSTDCVFSGKKGNYNENDFSDAIDSYGVSKFLGEDITGNNLIIRTSIIGHELKSSKSLLEWFLLQKTSVKGYVKAYFSGFTTNELARILQKYILANKELKGLFHLSSKPICKYNLLRIIKKVYKKKIKIIKNKDIVIDRTLDSTKFKKITKFKPRSWDIMIKDMYKFSHNKK
jgi:dTDP-4-dehydrorhamnose reductase